MMYCFFTFSYKFALKLPAFAYVAWSRNKKQQPGENFACQKPFLAIIQKFSLFFWSQIVVFLLFWLFVIPNNAFITLEKRLLASRSMSKVGVVLVVLYVKNLVSKIALQLTLNYYSTCTIRL